MTAREAFLTLGGVGYAPKAPGTFGTLVATALAIPLLVYIPTSTFFLLALLLGAIAVKEIDKEESAGAGHDAKEIVIDELVGVWIALSMVDFTPLGMGLAVLFFRLFDIWKPSIIGKVDTKVKGGLGVVGDDALAGFFAGLATLICLGAGGKLGLL